MSVQDDRETLSGTTFAAERLPDSSIATIDRPSRRAASAHAVTVEPQPGVDGGYTGSATILPRSLAPSAMRIAPSPLA